MASRGAQPVLSDGVVSLRPPRADDAPDVVVACQDPVTQLWTTVPVPYGPSDAEAWLAAVETPAAWWRQPTWAVTIAPDDRFSGAVDLRLDENGGADIGFQLAPWARGHGHATRAVRLACTWAFGVLGVDVVTWRAVVGNDASRASARSAGFRIPDAVQRRALVHRGVRRDAWFGDLLASDAVAAARGAEGRGSSIGPALTRRERDVLGRLALGESNRAMAAALGISENTVKNHVRSILEKLQAKSRTEAVVVGLAHGLTRLPS